MKKPRRPRTDAWAIDDGYHSAFGVWRATSPATHRVLVAAMGRDQKMRPSRPSVRVVRAGTTAAIGARGDLALEDGRTVSVDRALPPDVPLGYHTLRTSRGASRIIVVPARCHLPEPFRIWGWAAQLYAARSRESWGIGDLADLRRLAHWSARTAGAELILLNPLAAAA